MADDLTLDEGTSSKKAHTKERAANIHNPVVEVNIGGASEVLASGDADGLKVQQGTAAKMNVTEASASAIKTAVEVIDDAVAAEGDALGKGVLIQGDDGTDRTNVLVDTDGHVQVDVLSAPSTTVTATHLDIRHLTATDDVVKLGSNTGVDVGDVDVTSVVPGTGATNLGKAEDAQHNSGDVGVMMLGVANTSHAARAADGDYIPIATDLEGCVLVVGNVAHGVTDADPPVKIGGKGSTTAPSAVDANDRVNAWYDLNGRAAIMGQGPVDEAPAGYPVHLAAKALAIGQATSDVSADGDAVGLMATRGGRLYVSTAHPNRVYGCVADHNTAQTNHLLIAATGSASTSLYITDILISNGATAGYVQLLDGSGGTVLWQMYCAINGGCALQLHTPIKLTANTGLYFTSNTVTTHTVAASGFISAP